MEVHGRPPQHEFRNVLMRLVHLAAITPAFLLSACGGMVEEDNGVDATADVVKDSVSPMPDSAFEASADAPMDRWTPCGQRADGLFDCCGGAACKGMCYFENTDICTCFGIDGGCPGNTVCCLQFSACTAPETCRGGR